MKLLLRVLFENKKHVLFFLLTTLTMLVLLLSSQLEMITVGILTNKDLGFSRLFSKDTALASAGSTTSYAKGILQFVMFKLNNIFSFSQSLTHLLSFLVLVATLKAFSQFAYSYLNRLVSVIVSRDLREKYFQHIQSLPMSFYHEYNIGSLSARVLGDAGSIAESINSALINFIQTPINALLNLFLCFMISWKLSILVFACVPFALLIISFLSRAVRRVSKKIQRNQESFASVLLDFLSGIQTVKIYVMENFALKKYKEQNDLMAHLEAKNVCYGSISRPIIHLLSSVAISLILIYGLYIAHLELSELIVFFGLLWLFFEPVKKFAEENVNIQRGIAAAERMFEVLDIQPKIQDSKDAKELKGLEGVIEFDGVWFQYNEQWVLKDLSFKVKKGETVAIVGPTGAGKSTIVELLPRLYEIQRGSISIDGKSIEHYTQKSLRENISFVPQKPFLFVDSIFENIAFGSNFDPQKVIEAAKRAHADEFIQNLPEKYETVLSEGGRNLSGGQQQRLAIARALFKRAPILIMDEATSALDSVSEDHIKQAIGQLHGKVTQILVAHRFSTIEHADRIIYLEKGEKIAEGTRQELIETCPNFRLMWEVMHKGVSYA